MTDDSGDADGGEEIRGVSVILRCDAPKILHTAEHWLDGGPVPVAEG